MTRKEFMSKMFKNIFERTTIEYSSINNNTIKYITEGTFIKDCTYSLRYMQNTLKMIIPLFDDKIENVSIDKRKIGPPLNINEYRERAKNFVISFISNDTSEVELKINSDKYMTLQLLKHIYSNIIIDEIFKIESKPCKERGMDDFQDSEKRIAEKIKRCLFDNYEKTLFNPLEKTSLTESDMNIYYKSSMLRNFVDIKDYIKNKNIELIDLDSKIVYNFKDKIVYRFTAECFFEYNDNIDNMVRVTVKYNEKNISAFTTMSNWLNQSIIVNYIYTKMSKFMTCYFILDSGKTFQFLQMGEDAFY